MLRVTVEAHPGATRERVEIRPDGAVGVWVRARAVEGQANAAIEQAVATALRLRPRQVRLVSGHAQRRKLLDVELASAEELRSRLAAG